MAKDTSKPTNRARTEDLRREIESSTGAWVVALRGRVFAWTALVWLAFVLVVGAVGIWAHEQPRVAEGRVAPVTRTVGVKFSFADQAATEQARSMAKARAPRVYVAVPGVLEEIRSSLANLPLIARDAPTLEAVEPGIRQQFALTDASLAALRERATDSGTMLSWRTQVDALMHELYEHPLLSAKESQVESQALNKEMELRQPPRSGRPGDDAAPTEPVTVASAGAINIESQGLANALTRIVRDAGFDPRVQANIVARLTQPPVRPTYVFDSAASALVQDRAAASVPAQIVTYPEGEVIYHRGDVLTAAQVHVTREAQAAERRVQAENVEDGPRALVKLWGSRLALLGLIGSIALAMVGYAVLFVPRIRRNPLRMAGVAALLAFMAVVACWGTAMQPGLIALTAVAPSVFAAVVLCVAYNQRIALAYGALHGLLVCAIVGHGVGLLAVIITGIGAAVWRLREIRDRDTLIKAGLFLATALAGVCMLVNLVELPMSRASLVQAAWDAGLAGFGGLLVAMLMLFILPSLEKTFSITTGLTLIELRDPKQPLLRQLQQRAPGTYNHSLNLAALGEAAAEAIGADGLLTYVGALYHDIGKMNKPDYFVENQTPGFNRHDKLSPAMSLLIIVGHVKDGLELAREFTLPRPLWHFIESHHGTTLVEYFFHRAKRRAEMVARAGGGDIEDEDGPNELEYRYPGPKPRTKEAAIIMICDAVESAARAMSDPTPSRIDALVRAIATKRLMDGQFDECDLTLRELNQIVEAVSRTLTSIYHGRIAYPGDQPGNGPQTKVTVPVTGTLGNGKNVAESSPIGAARA